MSTDQLEFITYIIGNLAERLKWSQCRVYNTLISTGIINDYIIPGYDVLHSFSKNYLMDDLVDLMKKKGVSL